MIRALLDDHFDKIIAGRGWVHLSICFNTFLVDENVIIYIPAPRFCESARDHANRKCRVAYFRTMLGMAETLADERAYASTALIDEKKANWRILAHWLWVELHTHAIAVVQICELHDIPTDAARLILQLL